MAVIVQKFGGTSVANAERIKIITDIIKTETENNNQVIVVVSAMAGVTNQLVTYCNEISELNCDEMIAEYDAALATGEAVSAALTALALNNIGLKARSFQSWQLPIITDNSYSKALVEKINNEAIENCLKNNTIPVIAGFQGITEQGRLTTLGRGGSDITAVLVAASIKASRCDIYTDVEGVFTADPRIVHEAKKIEALDLEEMLELACSGAKVLQSRSASVAARYKVPLRILSSFKQNEGTIVKVKDQVKDKDMESREITAITSNKNLLNILIKKPKISFAFVCSFLGGHNILLNFADNLLDGSYKLIANLADKAKINLLLNELKAQKKIENYNIAADIGCISIIGYGMKNDYSIFGKILQLLENAKINVMQINSSETKISLITSDNDTEQTIKLIHDHFIK